MGFHVHITNHRCTLSEGVVESMSCVFDSSASVQQIAVFDQLLKEHEGDRRRILRQFPSTSAKLRSSAKETLQRRGVLIFNRYVYGTHSAAVLFFQLGAALQ